MIRGVLYLRPTLNTGGIWGLFDGLPPVVFIGVSVLFVACLVQLILRLQEPEYGYLPALALILGGFLGNGIDRLRNGCVTDFIDFAGLPAWMISTFNVADLAILLGLGWLAGRFVVLSVRHRRGAAA